MCVDRIDPAFANWFAGFADGEGCFYIGRICNRSTGVEYVNYRVAFTLAIRDDDRPILEQIQENIGTGRLGTRKPRNVGTFKSVAPMATLEVGTKAGARVLVDLFDRYPLRSKKARDFAIWREALIEWETKSRGRAAATSRHDWSKMAQLHQDLIAVRKYV
jgi:hypothetical protein